MATQEVIRGNQESEMNRQLAASNYGGTEIPQLPNGIPVLNDEALAASIEEWKATDIAYQRAQNSEQREQIENAYRATQQRLATAKQEIKNRAELETTQRNQADASEGDRLALEMQTLRDTFPANWTPETLPLDKLQALSNLRQKVQNLAAATGSQGLADGVLERGGPLAPANVLAQTVQQARPETFPDGSKSKVTQLEDGQIRVELVTGEIFTGDSLSVAQKIADANVNTKLWARQKVAQAQQPQHTPQLNQQPEIIPPATQQKSIADYWAAEQADALARHFGFSNESEMVADYQSITQFREQYNDQLTAMEFMSRCPDFPQTEQANQALLGIVEANGWQYTPDNMQAAHLLAVQNHVYQPLTQEQIQAATGVAPQQSRATPPPMIRGNSADVGNPPQDPYNMPMDQLRKADIKQELDRSGARY
jgi:hypothetical protein